MWLFVFHFVLAGCLFLSVNWIGKHADDFGYTSSTLFEASTESIALNFFLRTLSPAVFLIAISAFFVGTGMPDLRIGIFWVAVYYYAIRALIVVLLNRQLLISWSKFFVHAVLGIAFAYLAYEFLILPNISLLPDIKEAGNELWLAIIGFIYAVSNNVVLSESSHARRQNNFVRTSYLSAKTKFGSVISKRINDDVLELITYSILIYEDYARPQSVRFLERLQFWKTARTTGIMQVNSRQNLSDMESVEKGLDILVESWKRHRVRKKDVAEKVKKVIGDYNRDDSYIWRVLEVAEIISKRADKKFELAYVKIWGE
jgi:hypothetical protein